MKTSNSEYELIGEENGKLVVRVKHMGNQVITITNEARACLTVLVNRHFDYPIYFDLEEKWQFANRRNFCDSLVKSFCSILEQNGLIFICLSLTIKFLVILVYFSFATAKLHLPRCCTALCNLGSRIWSTL